ncbi:hypothetical protein PR048_007566 [Dryococelus australis]|uniref:Uncharacterized protein n=1 Tax=Dryococelus australis TaxID=614101 RepID=A0ABQ9HUM4_9NEOP|nr:hypothetical protein PR048_007566 [Dryococelus australis]
MEQRRNQERGKREIPEKTHRPAASSGTISTCETPGVAKPRIEPFFAVVGGELSNRLSTASSNDFLPGQTACKRAAGPARTTQILLIFRVPKVRHVSSCRYATDLSDSLTLSKLAEILQRNHWLGWLDYSPSTNTNRVRFPAGSHVGIVPDDAAGRRVFSGVSRFPRPCDPALLHTHLALPASALSTLNAGIQGGRGKREILEKTPTSGVVWHDSHLRKCRSDLTGIEPGSHWWEAAATRGVLTQSPVGIGYKAGSRSCAQYLWLVQSPGGSVGRQEEFLSLRTTPFSRKHFLTR